MASPRRRGTKLGRPFRPAANASTPATGPLNEASTTVRFSCAIVTGSGDTPCLVPVEELVELSECARPCECPGDAGHLVRPGDVGVKCQAAVALKKAPRVLALRQLHWP